MRGICEPGGMFRSPGSFRRGEGWGEGHMWAPRYVPFASALRSYVSFYPANVLRGLAAAPFARSREKACHKKPGHERTERFTPFHIAYRFKGKP